MASIPNNDKPNAASTGDYGELIATAPRDAPAPPAGDGDTWTEPPEPDCGMVGGMSGAEHNSPSSY